MPGVVSDVPTAERPLVLGDDPPVLADDDAVGEAWMSTGRPTALALTEYRLLSNRTRQVFDTEAGSAWNPSKRPR